MVRSASRAPISPARQLSGVTWQDAQGQSQGFAAFHWPGRAAPLGHRRAHQFLSGWLLSGHH